MAHCDAVGRGCPHHQNWIAASENTAGRPGLPSWDASQVISLSNHPFTHEGMRCRATDQERPALAERRSVAGPVRRAVAGGGWLAHAALLTAWIHNVNRACPESCNNALSRSHFPSPSNQQAFHSLPLKSPLPFCSPPKSRNAPDTSWSANHNDLAQRRVHFKHRRQQAPMQMGHHIRRMEPRRRRQGQRAFDDPR